MKMIISFVVAMGKNRVIGKNNSLPWNMPADMKRFRDLTAGKPMIMGRKTYESIGRPLPNRTNIIITRDKNYNVKGCVIAHSIDEAIKAAGNVPEAMVIGGFQIFKEFFPIANKIYLTIIDNNFEGDTYFPEYTKSEWRETKKEEHKKDKENPYDYTFLVLERKNKV